MTDGTMTTTDIYTVQFYNDEVIIITTEWQEIGYWNRRQESDTE